MRNASFLYRILLIIGLCSLFFNIQESKAQFDRHSFKAILIYHFAKYTTWPKDAFQHKNEPFKLGILGDDPIGPHLERIFNNRPINGRSVEIVRSNVIKDLWGAHIIFVSNSEKDRVKDIVDYYKGRINKKNNGFPTLTIADNVNKFCEFGGIINFVGERNQFEINATSAKNSSLVIYADVLGLAVKVL